MLSSRQLIGGKFAGGTIISSRVYNDINGKIVLDLKVSPKNKRKFTKISSKYCNLLCSPTYIASRNSRAINDEKLSPSRRKFLTSNVSRFTMISSRQLYGGKYAGGTILSSHVPVTIRMKYRSSDQFDSKISKSTEVRQEKKNKGQEKGNKAGVLISSKEMHRSKLVGKMISSHNCNIPPSGKKVSDFPRFTMISSRQLHGGRYCGGTIISTRIPIKIREKSIS